VLDADNVLREIDGVPFEPQNFSSPQSIVEGDEHDRYLIKSVYHGQPRVSNYYFTGNYL
jgi:hypothetical protein